MRTQRRFMRFARRDSCRFRCGDDSEYLNMEFRDDDGDTVMVRATNGDNDLPRKMELRPGSPSEAPDLRSWGGESQEGSSIT